MDARSPAYRHGRRCARARRFSLHRFRPRRAGPRRFGFRCFSPGCFGAVGVAGARFAPDRAAIHCACDPVLCRAPGNRHRGDRGRVRPGRRHRALLGLRGRSQRALDLAPGRCDLQLRIGEVEATRRRRGDEGRSDRSTRARALRRVVPALWSARARSVCLTPALPRRCPTTDSLADPVIGLRRGS